ncbi:MAG: hypothetical protein HQL21_04045 [Candidatus Omnitrophica bacterium]|nr:hypothetical protein [Candidatus Omnitrophota bacterium]
MAIKIVSDKISKTELQELAKETYVEMIKAVADVKLRLVAFGGELHADSEAVLLAGGSAQEDLWGFNIQFDGELEEGIEYTSLINIRPRDGNRSLQVTSSRVRQAILDLVKQRVDWDH